MYAIRINLNTSDICHILDAIHEAFTIETDLPRREADVVRNNIDVKSKKNRIKSNKVCIAHCDQ